MAIPRDPGGAPRRPQPRTRKRSVPAPHPEILRSAPPRPQLGPPRPTRRQGVFAQPVGRVAPVGRAPQRAAQRTRRAAERLPAEHQLPRFPVLRQYTAKQREIIRTRTEQSVRKIAQQRGIPGHQVVQKLYNEGDAHTRQTLQTYGRVVREHKDATHAGALDHMLTVKIAPKLDALTAAERDEYRRTGTLRNPNSQEAKQLVHSQAVQRSLRDFIDGVHHVGGGGGAGDVNLPAGARQAFRYRLTTRDRADIYRALTDHPTSEAKPGQRHSALHNAAAVPLAFLKAPDRNFLVAAAPGVKQLGKPIVSDLVSLPKDTIVSTYYTGLAIKDALAGDPTKLKAIGQSLKNHDPLVLAAQGRWNEALTAAAEHPVNTALEIGGLRGVGHGIGRLGRVSTEREAAVLPGTTLEVARSYSRDPIVKSVQQRIERVQVNKAKKLYAEAQAAEHSGEFPQEYVDGLYADARRADPRLMTDRQVEHRADVTEAVAQPAKRRGRAELKKQIEPLLASPKEGGHIQRLIVEGAAPVRMANGKVDVAALRRDLQSYHDDLAKQAGRLSGRRLKQNTSLRQRIKEGLKLSDEQLAKVADNSRQIAEITNTQEARNIAIGMLDPNEARTARLKTYAVRHMKAETRVSTAKLDEWRQGGAIGRAPEPQLVKTEIRGYTPKQANARAAELEALANAPGKLTPAARSQIRAQAARIRATRTEKVYSPLKADQILEHMKAEGVDPAHVAFVTQRPNGLGPGSFNVRALSKDLTRKGLPSQTRTGQAVIQGLLDTHPSRLTANVVRLQQLESADKNYVSAIHEVGARDPGGHLRVFTSKTKAQQFLEGSHYDEAGARIHGAPNWRIVRINPWGGRESQLAHLLEHGDPEGFVKSGAGVDHPISRAIEAAVGDKALEGEGPFVAVPEAWARRIADHSEVYRSSSPTLRSLTGLFRNTVLPFSLPWLFGNFSEAAIRSAVKSPRLAHNIMTYRRVLAAIEKVDPEEAARIRDLLGTGHYGMSETSNVYTSLDQFANSRLKPVAKALAVARRTHGPKEIVDAFNKWTDFVFHTVNSNVETPFREAIAGAHIRSIFTDPGSFRKISDQALAEAARGLRNTNAQVRMADEVRRAYGQYEAFSPGQRKFIVLYSPFAAWSFNAVNFLGRVLPVDHPVLTALLAVQNRVAQDYIAQHGEKEGGWIGGKSPVPEFLMGSLPVAGGGHVRASRYTPSGFFSDPAGSVADLILPQFSGAIHALQGQKFTGAPIKPHGDISTPEKFAAALQGELAAFIPFYGRINQALGYQGGVMSRIWQTENPLKVVKKQTAGAKQVALPKGYKAPSTDVHDYSGAYNGGAVTTGEFDYSGVYGG